jgi:hypothetical protein
MNILLTDFNILIEHYDCKPIRFEEYQNEIELKTIKQIEPYFLVARNFKAAVAFCAYNQCPNRNPRNLDKVLQAIEDIIKNEFKIMGAGFEYLHVGDLKQYIHDKLISIPEFVDWNLSQSEKDRNISVDDPNRPKITIVTNFDIKDDRSWYNEYVDLDSFIQNVFKHLMKL